MTREEAIKIYNTLLLFGKVDCTKEEVKECCRMAIKALRREPRKGRWIDIKNKNGTVIAVRCSRCGNSPKHAIKSDFCPNCGADMREVEE